MALDFRHASVVDGVRFTAQIGLPNVVLGLFAKRTLPTRVSSTLHGDQLGYHLVEGMVRRLGPDPFWVRVAKDEALLVHHPDDLEIVLGGSPDPFASDPDTKRKGMTAFQPNALTISRGDLWANRRRFAEAVLSTDSPLHPLAPRMLEVCREEAAQLVRGATIGWQDLHRAFQRVTRRVVLGESGAQDEAFTDSLGKLMAAGNRMPGKPAPGYEPFVRRVQHYVEAAEPDSLCSLVAQAPADDQTDPVGQLIHWLFAMGDTLPANLMRTLALLASHPDQCDEVRRQLADAGLDRSSAEVQDAPQAVASQSYLAGCIQEAMRLWPTTALFGRVAVRDVRFPTGVTLPAGSQVLIYNVFNHRNRERIPYADRFAPEEWVNGDAATDWSFNFFSHGPQGCPGAGLAIFLGQALLAAIIAENSLTLSGARLSPRRPLPHSLDIYGISIRCKALSDGSR